MSGLEEYFSFYRNNIVGINKTFLSPYGEKKIIYADWIASGRLYEPIERKMLETFGPYVGNTHSESSITGEIMTLSYNYAHGLIKKHVNAGPDDVIITAGSGMTAVINKFQRILGLKIPEQLRSYLNLPEELKPVVFITHMEHHSNQTSWLETIADVICIDPDAEGLVDLNDLQKKLDIYKSRKLKIGSFSACSNVTGIKTPYHEMAKLMHDGGGFCFVDFACSAPYSNINMHPDDLLEKLDAVFFSPHKFLGGPGTPGVIIFDSKLYHNRVPDNPGGGTVDWTNPWGDHKFINNIELREDGGTPAFLQTIKAALCIELKEKMAVSNIEKREEQLVKIAFEELRKIPKIHIFADNIEDRLGAISLYFDKIHYNLVVKLLNDRFGIQVRGGCTCAGTYGHFLLHVTPLQSHKIISLHPTMTDSEVYLIAEALREIVKNISGWEKDYKYISSKNEYVNTSASRDESGSIPNLFLMDS
jgi:selenocysteine lyase/cysteine desulfurase